MRTACRVARRDSELSDAGEGVIGRTLSSRCSVEDVGDRGIAPPLHPPEVTFASRRCVAFTENITWTCDRHPTGVAPRSMTTQSVVGRGCAPLMSDAKLHSELCTTIGSKLSTVNPTGEDAASKVLLESATSQRHRVETIRPKCRPPCSIPIPSEGETSRRRLG